MPSGAGAIRAGRAFVELFAEDSELQRTLRAAERRVRAFGNSVQAVGRTLTAGGVGGAYLFGLSAQQFAEVENRLLFVRGASGATEEQFAKLTKTAESFGRKSSFSTLQVADAMRELALAGAPVDQIISSIGSVLQLARGSMTDLTLATATVVSTMSQFSLGITEGARVANVLQEAANESVSSVEDLGQALKFVGPVGKGLGVSLEETSAAIAILANAGLRGTIAGTQLGRVFKELANSTKQVRIFEVLGLNVKDAMGNLLPFADLMSEINQRIQGMGNLERLAFLEEIFGRGQNAVQILGEMSARFKFLTDQFTRGGDAITRMNDILDEGLLRTIQDAQRSFETMSNTIAKAGKEAFQSLLKEVTGIFDAVTEWVQRNRSAVKSLVELTRQALIVGGSLIGLSVAIRLVGSAISIVGKVLSIPSALGEAFGKLIPYIMGAGKETVKFGAHMVTTFKASRLAADMVRVGVMGVGQAIQFVLKVALGFDLVAISIAGVTRATGLLTAALGKLRLVLSTIFKNPILLLGTFIASFALMLFNLDETASAADRLGNSLDALKGKKILGEGDELAYAADKFNELAGKINKTTAEKEKLLEVIKTLESEYGSLGIAMTKNSRVVTNAETVGARLKVAKDRESSAVLDAKLAALKQREKEILFSESVRQAKEKQGPAGFRPHLPVDTRTMEMVKPRDVKFLQTEYGELLTKIEEVEDAKKRLRRDFREARGETEAQDPGGTSTFQAKTAEQIEAEKEAEKELAATRKRNAEEAARINKDVATEAAEARARLAFEGFKLERELLRLKTAEEIEQAKKVGADVQAILDRAKIDFAIIDRDELEDQVRKELERLEQAKRNAQKEQKFAGALPSTFGGRVAEQMFGGGDVFRKQLDTQKKMLDQQKITNQKLNRQRGGLVGI